MSLRNWTINEYTPDEWETLAQAPARIRSLIIANTGAAAATVSARITNGSTEERAIIIPALSVAAGEAEVVDLCLINLGRSDQLQVQADAADVHFTASGEDLG